MRALGATVAIDDFGTGYSALSILRQLPLNRIKIDRSFVSMIDKDASFARLIVTMGRQLGLTTIAEGIESVLQLGALQAMHCEEGQGYLFSSRCRRASSNNCWRAASRCSDAGGEPGIAPRLRAVPAPAR